MKYMLPCISILFSATLCLAQMQDSQDEAEKEAAAKDREQHLQLMNDRLVHKLPQFSLIGTLKRLGEDRFSINGEPFSIDEKTRIQGEMRSGRDAEVRGFIEPGKPKVATQVVILEQQSAPQTIYERPPDLGRQGARSFR